MTDRDNADSSSLRCPVAGKDGVWEAIVGLEVHAQIAAQAKLFSSAPTAFGAPPNAQTSLIDAGMPGMLPVLNRRCVEQGVRTGLGLNARINLRSTFDRKNYFYPDLPQGYQISQYAAPLVGPGHLDIEDENGRPLAIRIERIHLEQDAGKSIHDLYADKSAVDLNRSGVGLMEIVTRPDMQSAAEARAFVAKLRAVLRYLGTCDGNMEEGSLRADVNVSLRRPGQPLGTRAEIKNVNSIRFIGQAIAFEIERQRDLLEEGGRVVQETRLFDPASGATRPMRGKEDAHDYRYFPDPDLPPLILSQGFVDRIAADLPELPDQKKQRLQRQYDLSAYDAGLLVADRNGADFFEKLAENRNPKLVARWVVGDVFAAVNRLGVAVGDPPIAVERIGVLLDRIAEGVISERAAKDALRVSLDENAEIDDVIERLGIRQISDRSALEAVIDEIAADHPDKVEQLKTKPKALGWFVGQAMKKTGGAANPKTIDALLRKRFDLPR